MIFAPKRVGNLVLDPKALEEDKKHCQKIGPCGLGKQAIYLNSFFIDRRYYAVWTDVRRVFKRVAMSRGGYTGKGLFGSIPYLVVQLANGREISCNFKYEQDVDTLLAAVERDHPDIPVHSKEAQQRLAEARRKEEARFLDRLSETAQASVAALQRAKSYLEEKPEIGDNLSYSARNKRSVDGVKTSNLVLAVGILLVSMALAIVGIVFLARGEKSWPLYCVLFGFAGLLFVAGAGILPTGRRNIMTGYRKRQEQEGRTEGLGQCGEQCSGLHKDLPGFSRTAPVRAPGRPCEDDPDHPGGKVRGDRRGLCDNEGGAEGS